ncbi:MAG: helix-turn-helix transcriptional regulator [bacterium]|nr:helix-turn-helix transcriptional regulator [bacterium]
MNKPFDGKTFGLRIRNIRSALKMSQERFGGSVGKTKSIVAEVEHGKSKASVDFIINLMTVHKVNPFYLLIGEGDMFHNPPEKPKMGLHSIGEPIKDWDELAWYVEHSTMVNHSLFGYAATLIHSNLDYVAKEIAMALAEEED